MEILTTISRAQSSLEFLLVLAAFMGALVVFVPALSYASEQIFLAQEISRVKELVSRLETECDLFYFLGDGSVKSFEVSFEHDVLISSNGKESTLKLFEKEFSFPCVSEKFEYTISQKGAIQIEKKSGVVNVSFVERGDVE